MVWPFHSSKEAVKQVEASNEEQLIAELPKDLGDFFKAKNNERFKFKDEKADEGFIRSKKLHNPQMIPKINCAEFEQAIMDCLKNGSTMDKLNMCRDQEARMRKCIGFQKTVIHKLGAEEVESQETYDKIELAADDLGLKWEPKVTDTEILPQEVLNDIYQKRNEIWKN